MKSSVRKKVLGIVGAVIAVFGLAVVMPVEDAFAMTVDEAESLCDDMKGSWKVTGSGKKKTGKCKKVKKAQKKTCTSNGGTAGKIDDGKFTCTWKGLTTGSSSGGSSGATSNCPEGSVQTSILGDNGCYTDDGNGGGVYDILLIVFNILSAGVGILGVVGLVISGLTYLTARDNEQQVAKAKSRIIQIVIGLAIYAVLFVALQWLIPGGIFGS